jgi:hypothetical protein
MCLVPCPQCSSSSSSSFVLVRFSGDSSEPISLPSCEPASIPQTEDDDEDDWGAKHLLEEINPRYPGKL